MFNLIDRYISKQIIWASLLILLLISGLQALLGFLHELSQVNETYQVSEALLYTGLMFPSRLLELFPMSVLIGTLSALGNMATNSELTVMRSAGMTTWRIAGSAIKGSILLMILVVIVGEWLAPISSKSAQQLKAAAISSGEVNLSDSGIWAKRGTQIIYAKHIYNDKALGEVSIFEFAMVDNNLSESQNKNTSQKPLKSITYAKSATIVDGDWYLHDIKVTEFLPSKITTQQIKSKLWQSPIQQAQLDTLTLAPEMLNFNGLIKYVEYLKSNQMDASGFMLALWRKLAQPLTIAIMIFMATSFVFGPMRSVSIGARVLTGVALGFAFYLFNQSFGPISLVYQMPPIVGAITPLIIFAGVGFWLMKKSS